MSESIINVKDVFEHCNNKMIEIPGYSFWAFLKNDGDEYRVFIEYKGDYYSDSFNEVSVKSASEPIKGRGLVQGIELKCTTSDPRQFQLVAYDFLDYFEESWPSPDVEKWCDSWKHLLGNKFSNNRVYDVLAEMLVYSYLQSRGMNPEWSGPDHERHDFRCTNMDCEVKSTLIRTKNPVVTISGGKQLDNENKNRPVKLFVCQLESAANGLLTINMLKKDLLKKNVDKDILKIQFGKTGLKTSPEMKKAFNLLFPIKVYDVDESFPLARLHELEKQFPPAVGNFTYTLSLDGLNPSLIPELLQWDRF